MESKAKLRPLTNAIEGEKSVKKVTKSEYKDMSSTEVDAQGTGTTYISFQLKGLWQEPTYKGTDYDLFSTNESGYMQEFGVPRVAQEGIYIAIPENTESEGSKNDK